MMFRPADQIGYWDNSYMEKRQLFLRSYTLSRKKRSAVEKIKLSLIRVRKVVCLKLRRLRRFLWLRLGRRRSSRFHFHPFINMSRSRSSSSSSSSSSIHRSTWSNKRRNRLLSLFD